MDDVEALCSEVTIVSTGRVVFSGPVDKLSAESGELDYRLVTSDSDAARQLVLATPGVHLVDESVAGARATGNALVVRAAVGGLDELVVRLVHARVAVRELTLVISPLEVAFLALTEQQEGDR
jgi:ABC-2 type transport system ATP-binding protein